MSNLYNVHAIAGSKYGYVLSDETKLKLSVANKGRKRSEETKQRMRDAAKGKRLSEIHKQRISEAGKGRVPRNKRIAHTEESIEKMRVKLTGQKRTSEQVENIRQACLKRYRDAREKSEN
jgi:hypothetical protein